MNRRSFLRAVAGVAAAFGMGPLAAKADASRAFANGLPVNNEIPDPPGLYLHTYDVEPLGGGKYRFTAHYGEKPLTRSGPGYFNAHTGPFVGAKMGRKVYLDGRDITQQADEINTAEGWARMMAVAHSDPDGKVKSYVIPRRRWIEWGKVEVR